MAYLQNPTRNRLDGHLALCVRMLTQDLFDLRTFPFEETLKKWLASISRGWYMMNQWFSLRKRQASAERVGSFCIPFITNPVLVF